MLADKESAFKKCLAGTNPLDRIRMVAPDTVGIDYLALEGFPLRLEAFPPRCPCETMVAGCNCPHSRNGIWNDAGDQDPDNQIDPGPIESVEEIMLYSPPVGLHDHGRLQDRDLCCVRGPSPQLLLARTVPIDEQVRPKPEEAPPPAPPIYLGGTILMDLIGRAECVVPVGDKGMVVKMPTEHPDHCLLLFYGHLFYSTILLKRFCA